MEKVRAEKDSSIPSAEMKPAEAITYLRFELFSLATWNHEFYHDGDLMDCDKPHCLPAATALRKTKPDTGTGSAG